MLKNLDSLDRLLPGKHWLSNCVLGLQLRGLMTLILLQLWLSYKYPKVHWWFWGSMARPRIANHDKGASFNQTFGMELAWNKHGTALLNKWAGESVHAEFDKHHSAFIVKDTQSESYPKKLLRAIQSYNADHI